MKRVLPSVLYAILLTSVPVPSMAAYYYGVGSITGDFETPGYDSYDVTYSGGLYLEFDIIEDLFNPPEEDILLDLQTLGLASWSQNSPPFATGFGQMRLWGYTDPVVQGGSWDEIHAPLTVSLGGVGAAGGHVFQITTLNELGPGLELAGWVAHDVYTTNLAFSFEGSVVPEPGGMVLLCIGLMVGAGVAVRGRSRRR